MSITDAMVDVACVAYDSFALNGDGDPHKEAMKLALAAAEAAAWQDMETAPKDGGPLLLYPTFGGMFDVAMGYWHHEHDCWYMVNVGHLNALWLPTNWRALPASPEPKP